MFELRNCERALSHALSPWAAPTGKPQIELLHSFARRESKISKLSKLLAMTSPGTAAHAIQMRQSFSAVLSSIQNGDLPSFLTAIDSLDLPEVMGARDAFGRSILHHASQAGHLALVKHMTDHLSMDVNLQDSSGETPLALACATGSLVVAKHLLSKGASPSLRKEPDGTAPLHRAANAPSPELIDLLIDAGAEVAVASKTGTPLCWAAGAGLPHNVEKLVARGAPLIPPPMSQTLEGEGGEQGRGVRPPSPLVHAAACGCERSVEILIAAGSVGQGLEAKSSTTALHAIAAVSLRDGDKSVRIARRLIEAGCDPNAIDEGGLAPLVIAAVKEHGQLVDLLLPLTDKSSVGLEVVEWSSEGVIQAARTKYDISKPPARMEQSLSSGGQGSVGSFSPPEPEEPSAELAAEFKRKGDEAFVKQDFSSAASHYSQSLRHETSNPAVWANRSMVYLKLKEPSIALEDARLARSIDPKYVKAWYREGAAFSEMNPPQWEDAALAFFEASNLDPSNKDIAKSFQDAISNGRKEHQGKSNR